MRSLVGFGAVAQGEGGAAMAGCLWRGPGYMPASPNSLTHRRDLAQGTGQHAERPEARPEQDWPSPYGDPDQIAITRSIRADTALRMATADRWRVRRRRRSG